MSHATPQPLTIISLISVGVVVVVDRSPGSA